MYSIIAAIYKIEKYLPQCIESVLAQTHTDFELILVDDGSPDACPQICDEYAAKDSRIKVIHKKTADWFRQEKQDSKQHKGNTFALLTEMILFQVICWKHMNVSFKGKRLI